MLDAALLACALNVSPVTMSAVVSVESKGDPLALNVNGLEGRQPHARSPEEAAILARLYIDQGYSVDVGLAQVNSKNFLKMGYTAEQILNPCTNLRVGGRILQDDYGLALAKGYSAGQPALKIALSLYNTGKTDLGFQNGYVKRYYGSVPDLDSLKLRATPSIVLPVLARTPAAGPQRPRNLYAADPQVFWSD